MASREHVSSRSLYVNIYLLLGAVCMMSMIQSFGEIECLVEEADNVKHTL